MDRRKVVPAFPNARYLFGREEWHHWSNHPGAGDVPPPIADPIDFEAVVSDSLTPIIEASLHQLVETNHRLTNEIALFPTPGHTSGHVSIAIDSDGSRAVIAGDVFHNPVQFADRGICSVFEDDRAVGLTTRTSVIHTNSNQNVLLPGSHFATPSGGYVVQDGDGWRFVTNAETFKG